MSDKISKTKVIEGIYNTDYVILNNKHYISVADIVKEVKNIPTTQDKQEYICSVENVIVKQCSHRKTKDKNKAICNKTSDCNFKIKQLNKEG